MRYILTAGLLLLASLQLGADPKPTVPCRITGGAVDSLFRALPADAMSGEKTAAVQERSVACPDTRWRMLTEPGREIHE